MPFTRSGHSSRSSASRHNLQSQRSSAATAGFGAALALAPDPQDPGMHEVDAAAAVQRIEALHHVVGFARAHDLASIGGVAGPLAPRHQRCHGPEPGFLGAVEGFEPALRDR